MAETVITMPAACLDYIDVEYRNVDVIGEYAGFSPSGHLLSNEVVINRKHPEFKHLPVIMKQPLALIQVAIKHNLYEFLGQPIIHSCLRDLWVGGRVNTEHYGKIAISWFCLWWLIVPYNILILLMIAVFPPFKTWYVVKLEVRRRQTYERFWYALCLVPCVQYFMHSASYLVIAVVFTNFKMMPFWGTTNCRDTHFNLQDGGAIEAFASGNNSASEKCPVFGVYTSWNFAMYYMYAHVAGGLLDELSLFQAIMFYDFEIGKLWANVFIEFTKSCEQSKENARNEAVEVIEELQEETAELGREITAAAVHAAQQLERKPTQALHISHGGDSSTRATEPHHKSEIWRPLKQKRKVAWRRVRKEAWNALVATKNRLLSPRFLTNYLSQRGLDITGRTLCAISLFFAELYDQDDYIIQYVNWLDKEAVLSCECSPRMSSSVPTARHALA